MNPLPDRLVILELGPLARIARWGLVSLVLALLQLLLGSELAPAVLMAGGVFFGMMAVDEAGLLSALGLLNLLLVGRFLLGAYAVKNFVLGEPVTDGMLAPEATSATMMLGFAGVWLATFLIRRFVRPIRAFGRFASPEESFSLFLFALLFGTFSTLAVHFSGQDGQALTGGVWGLVKALGSMRNLSLPILMLYLWHRRSERWLTHPAVAILTLLLFFVGVLSTSKQAMAEPIAFYSVMAVARYGWRHPIAWLGFPLAAAVFALFIYPVSQYVRNVGTEFAKSPSRALEAKAEAAYDFLTDSRFRDYVKQVETSSGHWDEGTAYLPKKLVATGRFALVGEADRLVDATEHGTYTEWETITNSLLIAVPHFLYPQKPQNGSGNFLARYTGDLPLTDFTTQVSYGFMANAFNAFGLAWVLPISLITCLCALLPIALFTSGATFRDPWSMFAIVSLHQTYVESSFSGLFGAFNILILATMVLLASRAIEWARREIRSRFQAHTELPGGTAPPPLAQTTS